MFYRVKIKMGSCTFCKGDFNMRLKSCVCKQVSYCSKECQEKDWGIHKPSCPPFTIRESPGKGKGMFATRKIKEGKVIVEEYPLIIFSGTISDDDFTADQLDEETKAKILELHDPGENIKTLDTGTLQELAGKIPLAFYYDQARTEEMNKIFRIVMNPINKILICGAKDLYQNNTEGGFFYNFSQINHSCVPNAMTSWVMGDFKRRQVRAIMTIEKDEEILISYRGTERFVYGSREFRQQELLETGVFLCKCSECSLEGDDLEENDRMRAEIREKMVDARQLLNCMGSDQPSRRSMKKVLKLVQQRVKLILKLNIRTGIVGDMLDYYNLAVQARGMDISCENDPDIYKQEALKYAKIFGDRYIYMYNKTVNINLFPMFIW